MSIEDAQSAYRPLNKFRSSNGQRLTSALFYELNKRNPEQVLYTLKRYNNKYPSLYLRYMELEDQTEYLVATTYFEDWEHWTMLCDSYFFKPYILNWRHELDLKIRSQALMVIREEARDPDSKNKFAANKILIDRSWENKAPTEVKAGRPSKLDIERKLNEIVSDRNTVDDDLNRIKIPD